MFKYIYIFLVFIFNCAKVNTVQTVENVNLEKFMGDWFVIASVPTFIEKNAINPIETYTLNDNGYIDTKFTFYTSPLMDKKKTYTAKAYIKNRFTNAEWGMQFFWPIRFSYLIIDLEENYKYTVISVPSKKYIWIMSKSKMIDELTYNQIIKNLDEDGYNVEKIKKTNQILD